ncbi:MAG: dephospho-CoA kinase [Paludibacteraceae bacterium]|nr:dephospho-CoA kinase [Paludibacteraceae bacterium]
MIIGLTGGIGSGKSVIAHGLQALGYTLYDTDYEAKQLLKTPELTAKIKLLLGNGAYDENGNYQTAFVADKVFTRPELLQQLNSIVHPAVQEDIVNKYQQLIRCTNPDGVNHLIVESAILFESGLNRICDKTIAVTAPMQTRIQRVINRDATTIDKVRARMGAQMIDSERVQRADITVCNDGSATIDQLCLYIKQHL